MGIALEAQIDQFSASVVKTVNISLKIFKQNVLFKQCLRPFIKENLYLILCIPDHHKRACQPMGGQNTVA